jgi:carbon-monoxide dehydrogenase large subunit
VRWSETRTEHMTASHHSGEQVHDVRVAAKKDGTILAIDVKIYKDVGAYCHFEMVCQTNTVNHMPTHYRIPNIRAEGWSITTNKAPVTPYRGAGRLEATFTMDRILDLVARRTKLDPLDVRRRNIIPGSAMPYKTGLIYRDSVPVEYDGGDYEQMLEKAIGKADYQEWRKRQQQLRNSPRAIGIGISSYVEGGGIGPCEGATIRIDDNGRVTIFVGVNSQGQSHETTFAQICAKHLGARFEDIDVVGGNTRALSSGFGTSASRELVNPGYAVFRADVADLKKLLVLAGALLKCDPDQVEIKDSVAAVKGAPDRSMTFAELALMSQRHKAMAPHGGPGLIATEYFYPRTVTWSAGVHVAVVELDRETGKVDILKYVIAHDSGVPINPAVVEGQIVGGVAQGLGTGLNEEIVYKDGQLLSGSFMDYAVMRADEMPEIEIEHFEFPTKENPLGVRAVGESGPISPPAALAAAIEDAIGGEAIVTHTPVNVGYIVGLLRSERAA